MFQDENENLTPYTKNYDYEAAAQTKDAGTYAVMGQPAARNPEQHDSPVAQNAGRYPVSAQPDYTPRATGSYAAPTQQDYYPQGAGNYPLQPQQNYGSPASSPTYRSYPAPGQQAYLPPTSGNYGNYPAPTPQSNVPQTPKKPRGMRTGAIMALTLVIILIFGIGIYAGWQFGGTTGTTTTANSSTSTKVTTIPDTSTIQGQQEAAIAIIEPSVVELTVTTSQGEDIGSGVIIDKSGDIITNNHVVNGGQTIKVVLSNGKTETAQLIGTSAANDLAIVQIQPFTNMVVATIGDSSKLIVGQEVLAVGNPLGITQTATRGIVSALNRSIQESASTGSSGVTITGAIQTDAPINPGNSGGALINLQGQLVGIPTLTAVNTESNTDANGIGFAIPSSTVQTVIAQILNK
jgi:S1-C subfamily serine protease